MFKEFLLNKGISPSSIRRIENLEDLAHTTRSTVLKELGIKEEKKGARITGLERDIQNYYDEAFEESRNPAIAQEAALKRSNALEYGATIGIINKGLKGNVPDIGTPSRLLIDEYTYNGENAAENLRKSLIQAKILQPTGLQHSSYTEKVKAEEKRLKESGLSKKDRDEFLAKYSLKLLEPALKRNAAGGGGGRLSAIQEDAEGFETVVSRGQKKRPATGKPASPPRTAAGGGGGGSKTGKPATGKPATGKPAGGGSKRK
jgi:hypothetical protein